MQEIQDFEVEQTQQSSCGATRGVAEVVWCGGCPQASQGQTERQDARLDTPLAVADRRAN